MLRSNYCGKVNIEHLGKEVELAGWVNTWRDHGGVIFIDLRDRTGVVQLVFNPAVNKEVHAVAQGVRDEFVLNIKGIVEHRPEGTVNKNLSSGEIELRVSSIVILNPSKALPFQIRDDINVAEEVRLQYRYLDLRRPRMFRNFNMRHKVSFLVRDYLDKQGFLEVETPILFKTTPEGARDYLVPSRVNPGEFYALPQSPQMLKQTLMISGFDKYFQLAKCFRDEDLRADRQPEFTQIDIEMSFISEEDIITLTEGLVSYVFKNALGLEVNAPFKRLTYDDALDKYGTDKPDLRFGLELVNITELVKNAEYKIFASVAAAGGIIKGLNAKKCGSFSRMEIENLIEFVKTLGAKGMSWFKVENGKLESNLSKFFSEEMKAAMLQAFKAEDGDLILIIADKQAGANQALDHLRRHLGEKLKLIDRDAFVFEWVLEFPLFGWNEEEKRFDPMHHPFTSPKTADLQYFEKEPGKMKARAYDLVLNGTELGGGSIRIHTRAIQELMFKAIGITEEQAKDRFGFLMDAFEFGTPPHGGIAFGLDRLLMLMLKETSLRDVIAFPKTQKAQCPLSNAPSSAEDKQLRELHIKVIETPKKEEKKGGGNE